MVVDSPAVAAAVAVAAVGSFAHKKSIQKIPDAFFNFIVIFFGYLLLELLIFRLYFRNLCQSVLYCE